MTDPATARRNTDTDGLHPFNPLKILVHADRIRSMLDGGPVFPVSVEIDLSNRCTHACPWCSYDGFRQANWVNLPGPRVLTLLDELKECGVRSLTFTGGGEPMVHTQAAEIFRRATALGLQWGVVTNGFQLTDEKAVAIADAAVFVRVSLDAGTSETHQRLHAAPFPQFEIILDNMLVLRQLAGHRLTIGASMCIFDSNIDEIHTACERLRGVSADYIEIRPVYPTAWRGGRQDDAGISDENIDRAKSVVEEARARYQTDSFHVIGMVERFDAVKGFRHRDHYAACRITPLTTVINADGYIYACCALRGIPAFRAGSVLTQPFREVWMAQPHKDMLATIDIDRCPKCRYVGLNRVIEQAFLGDALHASFV